MSQQQVILERIENHPFTSIDIGTVRYISEVNDPVLLKLLGNSERVGELLKATLEQAMNNKDTQLVLCTLQSLARIPFHKLILVKNALGKAVGKVKKAAVQNNDILIRDMAEHLIELWKKLYNTAPTSSSGDSSGSNSRCMPTLESTHASSTNNTTTTANNGYTTITNDETLPAENNIPNNVISIDMLTNNWKRSSPVALAISKEPPMNSSNNHNSTSTIDWSNRPQLIPNQQIFQNMVQSRISDSDSLDMGQSVANCYRKRSNDDGQPPTYPSPPSKRVRFKEELTDVRTFDRHPSEWEDMVQAEGNMDIKIESDDNSPWRKPPRLRITDPQIVIRHRVDTPEAINQRNREASTLKASYVEGSKYMPMTPSEPEVDDSRNVNNNAPSVPIIPLVPLEDADVTPSSSLSTTSHNDTTLSHVQQNTNSNLPSSSASSAQVQASLQTISDQLENIVASHPELVTLLRQLCDRAEFKQKETDMATLDLIEQKGGNGRSLLTFKAEGTVDEENNSSDNPSASHRSIASHRQSNSSHRGRGGRGRGGTSSTRDRVCRFYGKKKGCTRSPCPFLHVERNHLKIPPKSSSF